MKCRLVIFDFDGTLADTLPWFIATMGDLAPRYRFRRMQAHEVDAMRGHHAGAVLRHLGIARWKVPLIASAMRRRMAADVAGVALFPGVPEMMNALADAGVRLAIVSSNSDANVRRVLGPGLASLVEHYGCGAAMMGKRPKLRAAARALRVPLAQVLCIGDEIRDLEAAHAEGMAFGAVTWGFTRADALAVHAPAALFHAVDEIAPFVRPSVAGPVER
jgi:phosphoglycolate phosphatase